MSYREEMARLAEDVRDLLIGGGSVPPSDIPAAVAGHAALVGLLTEVHADLTGRARMPRSQDVAELERRPVHLLGSLLRSQPSMSDQPFSDVLQSASVSPAGRLWRDIAKSATLAQFEWQRAARETRPTGDGAWSEIADVAYFAEAIATLDGDVADSLASAGRLNDAAEFRRAGNAGLRVVAREVHAVAAAGDLPINPELHGLSSTRLLVTMSAQDLPEALHRLTAMTRVAEDLTPKHVAIISHVIAEAGRAAAPILEARGHIEAASAVRDHAELHSVVTGLIRRVVALAPGDETPGRQAQMIHDLIARLHRRGESLSPATAWAVSAALPQLTTALVQAADRQVATLRWVVAHDGGKSLGWGPVKDQASQPRLITALRSAARHTQHLLQTLTAIRSSEVLARPQPRMTLSEAVIQHRQSVRPPASWDRAPCLPLAPQVMPSSQ